MSKCGLLILIIGIPAFTDARFFRFDYTYYSDAGGWLKFHPTPASWDDARLRCFYEGSVLASPLNDDVRTAMKLAKGKTDTVFTGISATYSKGNYFSIEGVALESIPHTWVPGHPDKPEEKDCIAMMSSGSLADVSCRQFLPYICYKKSSKNIPSANSCGTVDPDYVFEARTGHCYKFHRFGQVWSKAFMACSAEGGYLAIINSETEAQVLRELINKYPSGKVMAKHKDAIGAGFHDWSQHGIFMTVHGQTLSEAGYDKWAGGQPDNASPGEYCGSMLRNAHLNDVWCEYTIPFICEMQPGSLLDNGTGSEEEQQIEIYSSNAEELKDTIGTGPILAKSKAQKCNPQSMEGIASHGKSSLKLDQQQIDHVDLSLGYALQVLQPHTKASVAGTGS